MSKNQNHLVQAMNLSQGSSFLRDTSTSLGSTGLSGAEDVETGSEAVEDVACPELAIIQAAQKAGGMLNNILTGISNYRTNFDYITTLTTGHGIGLTESATNKASTAYANSSVTNIGGTIGASVGGPLGALIGRGIAGLFEDKPVDAVAYSATGKFDPQSGNTPQNQEAPVQIPAYKSVIPPLTSSANKPYNPQPDGVKFLNGPGPSFSEINFLPASITQDLFTNSHVPDDSPDDIITPATTNDASSVSFLDDSGPDYNTLTGSQSQTAAAP